MSRGVDRTVYSSGQGRLCPECGRPPDRCRCRSSARASAAPPGDGIARVQREKKGRKGKTVTTVSGVPLSEGELRELASELKRRCGSGGALKDGVIEIQGDHAETLLAELERRGIRAKRAGG